MYDFQRNLARNIAEGLIKDFMAKHNLENLAKSQKTYMFDYNGYRATLNCQMWCFAVNGREAYGIRGESVIPRIKSDLEGIENGTLEKNKADIFYV